MIKSALSENTIRYAVDTTRTMTDVDFASKQAVYVILSDKNAKINIADEKCDILLKDLAQLKILMLDLEQISNHARILMHLETEQRVAEVPGMHMKVTILFSGVCLLGRW